MSVFLWILLILVIIVIGAFGYFYYQGATYVAPKVESSTAKSTVTDSSDSSKSISELIPKSPESKTLSAKIADKIADKKKEFQNASTKDKAKMLLKGAVLLTPVGLAAYGGSKLIKKMRDRKAKSSSQSSPSVNTTSSAGSTPVLSTSS